jgi:hypothetical protein
MVTAQLRQIPAEIILFLTKLHNIQILDDFHLSK